MQSSLACVWAGQQDDELFLDAQAIGFIETRLDTPSEAIRITETMDVNAFFIISCRCRMVVNCLYNVNNGKIVPFYNDFCHLIDPCWISVIRRADSLSYFISSLSYTKAYKAWVKCTLPPSSRMVSSLRMASA